MIPRSTFRRGSSARNVATLSQLGIAASITLFLLGCTTSVQAPTQQLRARYLMGTVCQIALPQEASAVAADRAFAEIARIESLISTWREESEFSSINRSPLGAPQKVSPEVMNLLQEVFSTSAKTSGSFNPLIRPLIDAWSTREQGRVPPAAVIEQALQRMKPEDLLIDRTDSTITRRAAVRVEEGGFGKGYALDRAIAVLRSDGIDSALIDFGGQLATFGAPRRVSIASPVERDRAAVELQLRDASLSTSSGSEKQFSIEGRTFTHIFDPRNGQALPPRGSVSVIAESALQADILSTALYVMGPEDGFRYAEANSVAAIFLVPEGSGNFKVLVTSSITPLAVDLKGVDPHFTTKE
jgi:thiamine biosynthesis lipoprotein